MKILGITELTNRSKPWRVRYKDGGQTRTKHFSQELDARDWVEEHSPEHEDITPEERDLIYWARSRAKHVGFSLEESIREFMRTAHRPKAVSLDEACRQYKANMSNRNLRPSYIENASYILDNFIADRESWPISSITPAMVVTYCRGQGGNSNQKTIRSRIITFLSWAKNVQQWTSIDTKQITWQEPKSDKGQIGIYQPDQVKALLHAAPQKLQLTLAVMFFTGVRPKGEMMKLTFGDFDRRRKRINIPETASKTRSFRTLYDLHDNFWAWYDQAKPKQGRICPMTYRNFRKHMADLRKKLKLPTWESDCSRHTFASCAFHKGLEWSLDIMGHKDSRLFLTDYKGLIDQDDAAKLWEIYPE